MKPRTIKWVSRTRAELMAIDFLLLISVSAQTVAFADEASSEAKVMEVFGGDTIVVSYGGDTVKCMYIGISAPEPGNLFGSEAWKFNKELLEGKTARLEFDERKYDEYGNLLAYVHCGDVFVNAELLKQGYASVMIISPNTRHGEDFLKLEREARKARRGMWAESGKAGIPTQNAPSLEEQIAVMEAKIEELSSKIDDLFRIIKELQSQTANAPSSVQHPESDRTDEQADQASEKSLSKGVLGASAPGVSSPEQDQSDQIVYVTRSGKKYHKLDCQHLKGRQYSGISIKEAERRGLQPCRVCFPVRAREAKGDQ